MIHKKQTTMRVSLKHVKTQKYLFSILTRYSELVPSKKSNGEFNEKLKKKNMKKFQV